MIVVMEPDASDQAVESVISFLVGAGFLVLAAIVSFFMFTIGKDAVKEGDDAPVHVG